MTKKVICRLRTLIIFGYSSALTGSKFPAFLALILTFAPTSWQSWGSYYKLIKAHKM